MDTLHGLHAARLPCVCFLLTLEPGNEASYIVPIYVLMGVYTWYHAQTGTCTLLECNQQPIQVGSAWLWSAFIWDTQICFA